MTSAVSLGMMLILALLKVSAAVVCPLSLKIYIPKIWITQPDMGPRSNAIHTHVSSGRGNSKLLKAIMAADTQPTT